MNSSRNSPRKPIGILGGGQLARMMVLEAHRLGLPIAVMSPFETDPAREVCSNWRKGDPNSANDLKGFLSACSSVTFESEFFDAKAIEQASQASGTAVWPKPAIMEMLQDRLTQKQALDQHSLMTSPWHPVSSADEAREAFQALGKRVVFKKRRFGYDGYGTFVVQTPAQLKEFLRTAFTSSASGHQQTFIAEKFVPFKRELAIVAVRDQFGSVELFPFVESKQLNSRCLWVKGPLARTRTTETLKKKLRTFLSNIHYVGAIGVELFESRGEFIVNELAPRVHNTGHYTLDTHVENQFSMHLRAVAGQQVPTLKSYRKSFVMWNLLGSPKPMEVLTPESATPAVEGEAHLHWYGKRESRPGRKMGHLTVLATDTKTALKLAEKLATRWTKQIGL